VSADSIPANAIKDDVNTVYLMREKSAHITKAARSATAANILAPLLCIPMFSDEVGTTNLAIWLSYMLVVVALRTWFVFKLDYVAANGERQCI